MKNAFLKISDWIKNHLPTKRRLIQIYAALLFNANLKGYVSGRIYTGKTKYACVPGMNCYSCPGAVGSCPLGALQNALASSGNTAPYYVIGIILLFGLILGRTICGYLCPVGLGQELLYKLRTPKLKKSKFTRILSYLKYVLLFGFVILIPILYGQQGIAVPGFCKYVCPAGTFGGGLGLLLNPNNQDYLDMLGPIFTWKFSLLMVIMAACVFCYRAFCRFLCPLGAIYGFFNRFCFIGVHVDGDNCTNCGMCVSHCKMDVRRVGDHECINCGECISVCPTKAISYKGGKLFLRRNEVDGSTESPVPGLTAEDENAITAELSASNATRAADAPSDAASAPQTTLRRTLQIDGYAGLKPATVPSLALENAGISLPNLAPDTGLPSGGNDAFGSFGSDDEPSTDVGEDIPEFPSQSDPEKTDRPEYDQDENDRPENEQNDAEDSTSDVEQPQNETLTSNFDEKAQNSARSNGAASANGNGNGASASAKLKAAARTPKFWMQCVAVILALALLIGAFVYFGMQEEQVTVKIELGALCPDFSLRVYEKGDDGYSYSSNKFTLSEHIGEVVVINFWATWCGPCVAELPDFELLKQKYPQITVIAIHGDPIDASVTDVPEAYVSAFLDEKGWKYITFAQDILSNSVCETFRLLGGKDSWPMTLILDKEGKVSFIRHGKLGYETLSSEALKLL